ncbi:MAG: hypothetical protein SVM80_10260 [Halobacteriota archaeon]|nr:hypothetical protein [Halobacteriota archaeon]
MQEFAVLMNCSDPKEVFKRTVHVHPTLSELMNEAQTLWED